MTIREQFQSRVDSYISDLDYFATGGYLREEEKDTWEPLFDATALPRLRAILEGLLHRLDGLPDDPPAELLHPEFTRTIGELMAFNKDNGDAVLEPEEFDELNELFSEAAGATGADGEAVESIPILE